MSAGLLEAPLVASKPKGKPVKVSAEVYDMLTIICTVQGVNIQDYVSAKLAPIIAPDFRQAVAKLNQRAKDRADNK